MKTKYLGLIASAGLLSLPGIAAAAPATAPLPSLSDILVGSGIAVNGYISASYEATFNDTGGGTTTNNNASGGPAVPFHQFDNNANSFMLNQAALTVSYLPTDGFGALVNVITGDDAKVINGAYGDGTGSFNLTQAYVQYAHGPLTVIGGRFVTLAGEEVIDDTKNNNISRSLLFTNMEPLVHTGIRASWAFNSMITGYAGANNSAFAFPLLPTLTGFSAGAVFATAGADTDKHKTGELGVAITPTKNISINAVDYYGVDNITATAGTFNGKNNILDVVANWQVTPALALGINGDYDILDVSGAGGFDANAEGVATYVSFQATSQFKVSGRGEYMRLGVHSTGATINAHLAEVTLTGDYSATPHFDVLAEGRIDYGGLTSSGGFLGSGSTGLFPSSNTSAPLEDFGFGDRKSQPEVLVKAIYKFGTPAPST